MKRLALLMVSFVIVTGACSSTPAGSGPLATAGPPSPAIASPTSASASPTSASASPTSASAIAALYEKAKAEGKFEFWGGEDAGDMTKFFALFATKYPGITPTHVQLAPDVVAQKLLTEAAGGQGTTPDMFNCNLDLMTDVLAKGLVNETLPWQQVGVDPKLIDPVGGISSQIAAYGLAYNTNLLKASDIPTTWDGLVNTNFTGKLSLDPRGNPFNILAAGANWGEQKTVDYVKRLITTDKPVFIKGATAGLTSLAAGETSLRPAFISDVRSLQAKGAPIGFVWLSDIPVKSTYWYVATGAKDAEAAELFAYWFATSPEANALQDQLAFRSNALPADVPAGTNQIAQVTQADYDLGAKVIGEITPSMSGS